MKTKWNADWPVLTTYDQDHLSRIALPLGGIGTGTVSLGGRGDLRDWEIVNRPAKGFIARSHFGTGPFFALYAKQAGGEAQTRALESALEVETFEGASGARAANHGLPRFRHGAFAAAYPFGQVFLSDPEMPLDARIEAFNPLVPADPDASGIPVAILRFVLTNKTAKAVAASVCGTVPNFIGTDGLNGKPSKNANAFKKTVRAAKIQGLFMESKGVDPCAEQYGTMALATTAESGVTARRAWANLSWGDSLLDFWDDFSSDGELEDRKPAGVDSPTASLAVSLKVPPRGSRTATFLLTWHFPNRQTWTPKKAEDCGCEGAKDAATANRVGNYYTTQYRDAWDAAARTAASLRRLETDTLRFVESLCASNLPEAVKEAALYNLSTLRSQTCFRTEDGRFFGFEGCGDNTGCCLGSCTHVWNYEQAVAFLFGDLARSMRETEFLHATDEEGRMSFRVSLPLERAQESGKAAADGQMGCLMKIYRDWQLSGDDGFLRRLWPNVRKAIEFCWIPGGWDADRDGVMEGCQHNTMDVEYYGPNPQMGFWYLGALRAAEEMARHLGEDGFAGICRDLFERGRRWIDGNLFNGEYYEHEIRPPKSAKKIAAGLCVGAGSRNLRDPDLQLGAGCLVDQLVGQCLAHVCGLGYLADPAKIRTTLRSIMKHNFRASFFGHFNHLRSFVLNDESALLMASYPRGRRPKRPFPYFNEVMTGFEYTAAVGMLYEGQTAAGLKCIQAIRDRYDGRKRSPFDEAECGHHYARAMASWAAVLALTGFHYSGVAQTMTFAAQDGQCFWSNGRAWGTCRQRRTKDGVKVDLQVLHGSVKLRRLVLTGAGEVHLPSTRIIAAGRRAAWTVRSCRS
jgi:uncharacterized protein (DUF608 family)